MVSHRKPATEAPQSRALYETEVFEHQMAIPRTPHAVYLETLDGSARYQIAVGAKNVSVHGLVAATRRHAGSLDGDVTPGTKAVTEALWPEHAAAHDIVEQVTDGTSESVPIHHYATEADGQEIGGFNMVAAPDSVFLTFPGAMRSYVLHDQAPSPDYEDPDSYFNANTLQHIG